MRMDSTATRPMAQSQRVALANQVDMGVSVSVEGRSEGDQRGSDPGPLECLLGLFGVLT